MSRLREIAGGELELEMTPMIDVTFLLLIFFLCTIEFRTLEGKLSAYLPKDVGANARQLEPLERVEIRIQVVQAGERRDALDPARPWSGTGPFEFVGRELAWFVGPRQVRDLQELRERLAALHAADPQRPATIAPQAETVYGDVVPVLDRAIEVGFRDVTFVREPVR